MKKLNFGCGEDILPGHVNMDILAMEGVDVVHDFNSFPYPFADNTFDVIFTSHVLEHLDDLVAVMAELRRIAKPGAKVFIRVPHFSCGVSYRDPTHKRLFSYHTFDYFTDECFYDLPKFRIAHRKLNYTRLAFTSLNIIMNPLLNMAPTLYERFFCWMLPCAECLFTLEVTK